MFRNPPPRKDAPANALVVPANALVVPANPLVVPMVTPNKKSDLKKDHDDYRAPLTLRRLYNRNKEITTHADRVKFGFKSTFDSVAHKDHKLPLKFSSSGKLCKRRVYRVCSCDGLSNKVYLNVTSASNMFVFAGLIGLMTTMQTYTTNMIVENPSTAISAKNVLVSVGVLLASIFAIQLILYLERMYMRYMRTPEQLYNRERFKVAYGEYLSQSQYADDRSNEYDSECEDPDESVMALQDEEDEIVRSHENEPYYPKKRNCFRNLKRFFLFGAQIKQ